MNIDIFKKLLETYGADLERWPKELVKERSSLLETNHNAQSLVSKEARIDHAIQDHMIDIPKDSLALLQSKLSKKIQNLEFSIISLLQPLSPKLSILALALVLGFCLGVLVPAESNERIYLDTILLIEDDEI